MIRQWSQSSALFMAIAVANLWPPICDQLSSILRLSIHTTIYILSGHFHLHRYFWPSLHMNAQIVALVLTRKYSYCALHAYSICSEVLFHNYQPRNNKSRNLTDFTYSFYDNEWRLSNVEHVIVLINQSITLVYPDMLHSLWLAATLDLGGSSSYKYKK